MATRSAVEHALERTRRLMRLRGYRNRTAETYLRWIRRFMDAHASTEVADLSRRHVEDFLDVLTKERRLAPKSRNQATSSIAFFFREVLGREDLTGMPRARESRRVPTVLSDGQVRHLLSHLSGKYRLLGSLMYGTGVRVMECHQLRVKDLDFDLLQITVRDGKGGKDRWVMLPERLGQALHRHRRRLQTTKLPVAQSNPPGGSAAQRAGIWAVGPVTLSPRLPFPQRFQAARIVGVAVELLVRTPH